MIREHKISAVACEDIPMSRRRAATLVTKMYADLVAKLRYENKCADPDYAEAVALAVMALKEETDV